MYLLYKSRHGTQTSKNSCRHQHEQHQRDERSERAVSSLFSALRRGWKQNSFFLPLLPSQQNSLELRQKQQSAASNKDKKKATDNRKQTKNNIKHLKHAEKPITLPKKTSDHVNPEQDQRASLAPRNNNVQKKNQT